MLRVRRGPIVEEIRRHPLGLEQRWTVGSRPVGDGDLVVTVELDGQLVAASDAGLKVRGRNGRLLTYGAGTWVSGDGSRHRVPAHWSRGEVLLRVPETLLDDSVYPATLDPIIGTPVELEAPVVKAAPPIERMVGSAGEIFVGHSDGSNNDEFRTYDPVTNTNAMVEASLRSSDPLTCHSALERCVGRSSVYDTSTSPWGEIPVSLGGRPSGGRRFWPVDTGFARMYYVSDGMGNIDYFVEWVDADGTVTSELVDSISIPYVSFHYACTGDSCLLLRRTDNSLPYSSFLIRRGSVSPGPTIADVSGFSTSRARPGGYYVGTSYTAGEVWDEAGTSVATFALGMRSEAQVLSDGRLVQVTRALDALDVDFVDPSGAITSQTFAATGLGAIAAFHCDSSDLCTMASYDRGTRVHQIDFSAATPALVDLGQVGWERNAQTSVSVAGGVDRFAVLFADDRMFGSSTTRSAIRGLDGASLHSSVELGNGSGPTRIEFPRGNFLGLWGPGNSARAFDGYNNPLDTAVTLGGGLLDSAGDGTDVLHVNRTTPTFGSTRTWANLANGAGAPLLPGPVELTTVDDAAPVSVAFGADTYLVVWSQTGTRQTDVFGLRMDRSATILDAARIPISTEDGHQTDPVAVFDGVGFEVYWRDSRDVGSIRAQQIGVDGSVASLFGVRVDDPTYPASGSVRAVHDGVDTFILYPSGDAAESALVTRRIRDLAADGATVVADPAAVGLTSYSIAALDGRSLIAYAADDAADVSRVWLVSMANAGTGLECAVAADCDSGFCVDGVCCEGACDGPCQTCRASDGAPADGECGVRAAGAVCRPSGGTCDPEEVCDGSATTCPADLPPPTECDDMGVAMADGGAGEMDAGPIETDDAGTDPQPDAFVVSDGAAPTADAGSVVSDSGAMATDGGSSTADVDAGTDGDGGGGCATAAGTGSSPIGWLVLALFWMRRRRR